MGPRSADLLPARRPHLEPRARHQRAFELRLRSERRHQQLQQPRRANQAGRPQLPALAVVGSTHRPAPRFGAGFLFAGEPVGPYRLALPSTPMRWIKSPAWDLVWILNPLWLAPLVLLLARGHDDVRASPVDGLFFALTVPLWFGHRVSSAWLAYATPAYRPLLATQRLRFVVAPLAIAAACFGLLLVPESVLPMPLTERVVWLAVLDFLLVSHHFAAQHFGLLSLYRARAGRASDAITRQFDRWFALVVGGGFVVLAEALSGSIAFHDRWIDPLLGAGGSGVFARTLHDGRVVFVVTLTAVMLCV